MAIETKIQAQIRKECSLPENRLFRNHVGSGYSPEGVHTGLNLIYDTELRKKVTIAIQKGYQTFGFGKGSSDLIGIQQVTITPDMVGQKVGVFTAVEVKDPNHKTGIDHLKRQQNFINVINGLGGRAGFATCVNDAKSIIGYE